MVKVVIEILGLHGLVDQQILGDVAQLVGVLGQDLFAPGAGLVEDLLDFLVDHAGGLLGIALGLAEVAADEDGMAGVVVGDGAEPIAHAIAHDHVAGDGAGVLDVAGGTAGDVVQEELLRRAPAEGHDDVLKHLGAGLEVLQILLRAEEREAAGRAAGNDGDIVDGIDMLEEAPRDGVAGLVIGGEPAGLLAHLAALLLGAHLYLEDGLVDILHVDEAVSAPYGQQRRLVHEVFEIRAREAGGALGDGVEIHVVRKVLVPGMNLQDFLAPADIRQAHIDLAVKAARTQQGVIEDIGAVGGRHDDDALVVAEAVHLHQQLVEGLLALVMAAAEATASLTADGVDLVNEDDGGGGLLGLLKQVAHAACADADIQLHKIGAGDGQKLHARLARDGLGQQGLAGARRAHQQHTLGDARAHVGIGLGMLEEIDDLLQLRLLFVAARDVGKGLLVLLVAAEPGARLGELGNAAGPAARAGHHKVPEHHGPAHDQNIREHAGPPGDDKALVIVVLLEDAGGILLLDELVEVLIEDGEAVEVVGHFLRGRLTAVGADLENDGIALRGEGLHLLVPEEGHQVGIVFELLYVLVSGHREDDGDHDRDEQNVKAKVSGTFRIQITVTSFILLGKRQAIPSGAGLKLTNKPPASKPRCRGDCGNARHNPGRSRRRRHPAPQSRSSRHGRRPCGGRACPSAWRW